MNALRAISELMTEGRGDTQLVSRSEKHDYTWGDFRRYVGGMTAILRARDGNNWILYCETPLAFAVGFMALLHAGKTVILPPNSQEGSLAELAPNVDGVVSDIISLPIDRPQFSPLKSMADEVVPFDSLQNHHRQIVFFTSGSTGNRTRVEKVLQQLDSEVATLESMWGNQIGNSLVLSTVSHQHIYGLLFGILWPLAAGRCFWNETIRNPERLLNCISATTRSIVISSPAMLKRMPELIELSRIAEHECAIFSSGGALHQKTAAIYERDLGVAPYEILGSTESGGIAWRRQDQHNPMGAWRPFDPVRIRIQDQGELLIQSPFIHLENEAWHSVGDCATALTDGTFLLHGRKDRIVKIEEKRISLQELESKLMEHRLVKACWVTVLHPNEPEKRAVLGALLVLSEAGNDYLIEFGRRALLTELERELLLYFERLTLPKHWRLVAGLPEDTQGKIAFDNTEKYFLNQFHPDAINPLLLKEKEIQTNHVILIFMVPEYLIYLHGHFPQTPIVPGVVQIVWVMNYAMDYLNVPSNLIRMEAVKFQHLLLPGTLFTMELTWQPEKSKLLFCLKSQENQFSTGRLVLRQPEKSIM